MVLGVEKLNTPVPGETILNMGAGLDREWESSLGMTAPPVFALIAQYHMDTYGTTEEDMARVSVKNHTHSINNPNAHFQKGTTLEKVMHSRPISTPFKLLDCSPVSDGAAAIIVTGAERAKDFTANPVYLLGTGQAVESFTLANLPDDLSYWPALVKAGKSAYQMAGIQPQEVDVAEVHDCFTIAELLTYEGLGWCGQGESAAFLKEGRSDFGGNLVVNPRGGLLACGHPLGATGVAQIAEIFWQLRQEAGARQVEGAKIGLTHNNSGPGEHTVNIFGV
jgi:acetyl-CoA C-acetyltransferase